jgi:hypothetical protein
LCSALSLVSAQNLLQGSFWRCLFNGVNALTLCNLFSPINSCALNHMLIFWVGTPAHTRFLLSSVLLMLRIELYERLHCRSD